MVQTNGAAPAASGKQANDHLPGQTGKEKHVEPCSADENGGSQVWLFGDQRKRYQQQQTGDHVVTNFEASFVLVEVPGQGQRNGDLQQF
jgi:hypothetical protein